MSGKILIVDDERLIRKAVRDTLDREGYFAVIAPDAEEALRRCQSEHFDLMITDLRMPGMTGLELIREARALLPSLQAVVLTAYGSAESAIEALRLGVSDYLMKPFRLSELRTTVNRLLNGIMADEPLPATAQKRFEHRFDLSCDASLTLTGTIEEPDSQKTATTEFAIRLAARAAVVSAIRHKKEINPTTLAETISDMLYDEQLAPARLVCAFTTNNHQLRACMGTDGSGFDVFGTAPATNAMQPAAGSFPGLRASASQVHFPEAESLTATGMTDEHRITTTGDAGFSSNTITLTSDQVDLHMLVDRIGTMVRQWGVKLEQTNDIIAAVNEAVLNAIEHAYGSDEPGKVDIECAVQNNELVAIVKDYGKGFDTGLIPEGSGLSKARRLVNRLAVDSAPEAGTTVYLAKALQ